MATTADDWTYIRTLTAITAEGNIPIDIAALAIEKLNVDIVASAIGNIPMNINEQGVGDIYINLTAENIRDLIVRPHEGGIESSGTAFQSIGIGGTHNFVDIEGKGALRYATFMVNAGTDSQKGLPEVLIDGTVVRPSEQFKALSERGYDATTRPIMITKYAVDGVCHGIWYFNPPIVFDTALKLRCTNWSSAVSISVKCDWFYQLIPP